MTDGELVHVDLSVDERELLARGVHEWLGNGSKTDRIAFAIGYSDAVDLIRAAPVLRDDIRSGVPLSVQDWNRALMCLEISFGSAVVACGLEWEIRTGLRDDDTISALRRIQRRLRPLVEPPGGAISSTR